MTTASLKETSLAETHRSLGARMVDFAGWNMPVQYKSIVQEHMATRQKAGLFDVSHMGEFEVSGEGAWDFLQYMVPNDLKRLRNEKRRAVYSQLVREDGGTVDDLIIYRRDEDFLLIVNASNIEKDWLWLSEHSKRFTDVRMKDISSTTALIALQGPCALDIFAELAGEGVRELKSFAYGEAECEARALAFGRTGYTGEDGFEIITDAGNAEWLWKKLLSLGAPYGIEPCGLGARDTLRLEAALPLYGHELTDEISPVEAGLGWSVKLNKGNYIGHEVLAEQKNEGASRQIVCLRSEGRALPRQGYEVFCQNEKVGFITSGSQGIFVGHPIAFALIDDRKDLKPTEIGTRLEIGVRDTRLPATVVPRPFYKRA